MLLVVLAGCSGSGSTTTTPSVTAETTATPSLTATPAAPANATDQALTAETERVRAVLENTSGVSSVSVGIYSEPSATITDRSGGDVVVHVTMPTSFEYSCDGESGAADGVSSQAEYRVTDEDVELVEVTQSVKTPCGTPS